MHQYNRIFGCEFSAPGKAIISGEHSIIYDKSALAFAIDLRVYCSISLYQKSELEDEKNVHIEWEEMGLNYVATYEEFMALSISIITDPTIPQLISAVFKQAMDEVMGKDNEKEEKCV